MDCAKSLPLSIVNRWIEGAFLHRSIVIRHGFKKSLYIVIVLHEIANVL
ncbi:hypothetical protein EH11_01656 [Bacillus subtilis]|nr:hypothetical protein EH11_01656 [Bacillus subtilis]RUS08532.1 hypothetical protein EFW59_01660 [Bacillus subtilis]